jgi:tRNA splicing ligase
MNKINLKDIMVFPAKAYLKYNGYLGIVGYNEEFDKLFVATKSTNMGDMQKEFWKLLAESIDMEELKTFCKEYNQSLIFEVIDPVNDPHIVAYDRAHIVLLDAIDRTWTFNRSLDVYDVAKQFNLQVKETCYEFADYNEFFEFTQMVESEGYQYNNQDVEGFVVEDSAGFMIKFKTDKYKLWKFMRSIKDKIGGGRTVNTGWFTKPEQNYVYKFMLDKGREYCYNHSIIDIRKDYENE